MSSIDIRIFGSANLKKAQSEFAKLERQIEAVNASMASRVNVQGTVDPGGYARVNRELQQSSQLYRQALASTGMFRVEQLRLNSATHDYVNLLQKQKLSFNDLRKQMTVAKAAYKEQLALQNMVVRTQMANFGGKQVLDLSYPTEVNKSLDTMRTKLGYWNEALRSGSQQLVNWGKNTQWAGRQLMVGFTVPLAAATAGMSVLAYQADMQLTRIAKVYDTYAQDQAGKERELARLRTQSMDMAGQAANRYGASLNDTLTVEAELAATGLKGNELRKDTMEVVRIATLGELQYSDAISTTIALQNAFKLNSDQLADTFNYMNAVENATSLTIQDIAEATPRAASAMAGLNVTAKEMTVLLVAMKERGVDAAEGANALKSATTRILNPVKKANEYFMNWGINLGEMTKQSKGNLFEFLKLLAAQTKGMDTLSKQKGIALLFGTYQYNRLNAALQGVIDATQGWGNASSQTKKAFDLLGASAATTAGMAEQEIDRLRDSISNKFQRAVQSLRVELAKAGEPFLKIGAVILEQITKIIQAFNKLPETVKSTGLVLGVLLALVGPTIMLIGLFANLIGNILKFGASIVGLLTKFELMTKEQRAAQLAAKVAEAGFISEAMAVQQLTAEIEKYVLAQQRAHQQALRNAPVITATGPTGGAFAQTGSGLFMPAGSATAAQQNAAASTQAAQAAEKQSGAMRAAAVSGTILSGAMVATMVSSNEVVDNIAKWAMIASIVAPAAIATATALKSVQWAAIGNIIATKWSTGMTAVSLKTKAFGAGWAGASGAVGKTGFLVKGLAGGIFRLLGPIGLVTAAVTAGVVAWKLISSKIDESARNVRKMTDNAEGLGKIVGFDPKEAGALDTTSKKASDVQKRVAAMRDEFTGVIQKIKEAGSAQAEFNTAMDYLGTSVIDKGGTTEQAIEAVKLALQAAGKTADEADAIVIKFMPQMDENATRDAAIHAAETFTKNAQDSLGKQGFFENLFSSDKFSRESEEWGKQAGSKIVGGVRASMDSGAGQGGMLVAIDKMMVPLQDRLKQLSAEMAKQQASGGVIDGRLMDQRNATEALIATINKKIITDLAGEKTAKMYSDAQLAAMSSTALLSAATVNLTEKDYEQANAAYLSAVEAKNLRGDSLTLAEAQDLSAKTARDNAAAMDTAAKSTKNVAVAAKDTKTDLEALISTFASTDEAAKALSSATQQGFEGAMQEYADQATDNFNRRMNAAMDAYKAQQDRIIDAQKARHAKAEDALDRAQQREEDRLDEAQNRARDRLDAAQDAQDKALERRQDARRKAIEASYDARVKKIQDVIDAEQKAEDIRQQIFEAEKTRLQRMAEMANRTIDFNAALNSGNLDEAAKIMNDAAAANAEYANSDAAQAGQSASDARKTALQKQIDAINAQKDARLDALKITEDAEKAALQASQKRQTDALQAQQKREKAALQLRLQMEKQNLQARQKAEEDALARRVKKNEDAEQRIWDGRKAQLDRAITDFKNFAPRNAAELAKHIKDITGKYDQFRVITRGKFNGTAADVRSVLVRNIQVAMQQLQAQQQWQKLGNTISQQMIKGAFNMTMGQFIAWVTTGSTPKNWTAPKSPNQGALSGVLNKAKVAKESRHTGGIIGSGYGSRAGLSGSSKSPYHHTEVPLIGQKGEMVVNKKATSKHLRLLHAINNGAEFGNSYEGRGGADLNFAGLLAAGLASSGIMAIGSAISAAGVRSMSRDNASFGGFAAGRAGKYGNINFNAEQLANAAIIANVGSSMGMSVRDIEIGIMTAITESMLRNLRGGDRDSVGLFQQRPSAGWGSVAQIMNPQYAARKFFEALAHSKTHGAAPWLAAQGVQRSFDSSGSNYRQYWDEAMAIFSGLVQGGGMIQDTMGGGPTNRTGAAAIKWAEARIGMEGFLGLCQKFVRMALGAGPGFGSALAAWNGARYKHGIANPNNVPAGVPVYWGGGKFGHVALSTGHGAVISTDFPNMGKVGRGTINGISSRWGKPLLGWTEDINGKRIYGKGFKTGGFIMSDGLANLHGSRNEPETVLSASLTKEFKQGVKNFADGSVNHYTLNVDARDTGVTADDITNKVMKAIDRKEARKAQSRVGRS